VKRNLKAVQQSTKVIEPVEEEEKEDDEEEDGEEEEENK
jgi:hypothetical protein